LADVTESQPNIQLHSSHQKYELLAQIASEKYKKKKSVTGANLIDDFSKNEIIQKPSG